MTYGSIVVINPADWPSPGLDNQDAIIGTLINAPGGVATPQYTIGYNATNDTLFHCSDTGYPPEGTYSVSFEVPDTAPGTGSTTWYYLITIPTDNSTFNYNESSYPTQTHHA